MCGLDTALLLALQDFESQSFFEVEVEPPKDLTFPAFAFGDAMTAVVSGDFDGTDVSIDGPGGDFKLMQEVVFMFSFEA